jgi:hypothetical protein
MMNKPTPAFAVFQPCALRAAAAVLFALASGCASGGAGQAAKAPAPGFPLPAESGVLSDYSKLEPSAQFASILMYRDDAAVRKGYSKLLFRPVAVWRGSDERLKDIPEADLQYLADSLYRAMAARLGSGFKLVSEPTPGALEIRLALTLVVDPKAPVDFFSTQVPVAELARRSGPLGEQTRLFLENCALEAEFAETTSVIANAAAAKPQPDSHSQGARPVRTKRAVRAAFFDRRRGSETPKSAVRSWEDVDAVFSKWSETIDARLVALREGKFTPKLTVAPAAH